MDNTSISIFLILISLLSLTTAQDPCRTSRAQTSCGQCIKANPDCAWCLDPNFAGERRCDKKTSIAGQCQREYIYQPKSNMDISRSAQVGSVKEDQVTVTQLQPQQVNMKMKPGESFTFPIDYLHRTDTRDDVQLLNSETTSQGVTLTYSAKCSSNERPSPNTMLCRGLANGDRASFNATVTLDECKTAGDAVISVGIGGVRDIIAVYVTPLCGCACEATTKQEHRSPQCSNVGSLVCGACKCDPPYNGDRCECSNGEQDQQCRRSPDEKACSGRGECVCGKCKCNHDYITGKYCECDETSCPVHDGMMCAAHGHCECGTCACESGYTGLACNCPTDTMVCRAANGELCSGRGQCICGECKCENGANGERYSGEFCERTVDDGEGDDDGDDNRPTTAEGNGEEEEEMANGDDDSEKPAGTSSAQPALSFIATLLSIVASISLRRPS